ncbi:sporulation protein YqfD [Peribacillus saganii]|uniref:Sporulation protein YqfD n=1 Tax=Peribacillus saganii TaxID=2303992 RepID=A0A372LUD3_9BACI|nr:sporulation protein YqfD [Peribacillus saganii]RFU71686.1 sporulation protein YqfD [Peribacillus saganii]
MKNQWTNFYTGFVKVKASGIGAERLINGLLRKNISIWDVKRSGEDTVLFCIELKDISTLRAVVRNSDCKVSFIEGRGIPFFTKRALKYSGFLIGLLSFFIIIFMLSNMVWGIEIKGANPETEHAIRKELDKIGVEVGKVQFLIDDVETIQRKLSDNIKAVTWIGVELKGTTFHFQVVEKEQPEEAEKLSPRNLVARKKAVIVGMFVEKGQKQVEISDYVNKGQLLVSGVIGNENNQRVVGAKGKVLGETWYKSTVEVPLKTKFSVFNGDEKVKHYINISGFSLPVWGFKKPEYKQYEVESTTKPFKFWKWELPAAYMSETYRSKEQITRVYTKGQAMAEAKKMAIKDLEKQLPEGAKIIGEKILHAGVDNGKVKLSIHYQVIEDIAVGIPIIQGD